jgi:serine/threonine protein kinase
VINERTTCDREAIERFLADRLDGSERRAFERHLDACDACRLALKEEAANAHWWREARSYLGSDAPLHPAGDSSAARVGIRTDGTVAGEPEGRTWSLDFLGPTDDPRMLGRFGGYEIAGVIGRGGMGIVLKGFDAALSRYVAIKALAPHLAESASARRRFAREAQAAAAVVHENVIAIHGVDEERGLPYLVMPYFRGVSLQKRLDEWGPLATCEALRIAMQTAAGLAAAHAQGLVHRDIKPANILLSETVERVKITDFGLARAADDASLTHSGVIAGTPQYMSPEQARGEPVDARSDLFSFGSVMYAMCTGHPPFRAETSYGVLKRITDTEPRPIRELAPETPEWLCRIIAKLHAKPLADRFQSAAEVAGVLEQCLAHVQNPAQPLPDWLVDARRARRSVFRWCVAVAGAAATLMLIIVLVATTSPDVGPHRLNDELNETKGATIPSADVLWDDGTESRIGELRTETQNLQLQTQQLWEQAGREYSN